MQPVTLPALPEEAFIGQLVSRGPGGVFLVLSDAFADPPVTLSQVLKYVRLEPPRTVRPDPAQLEALPPEGEAPVEGEQDGNGEESNEATEKNPNGDGPADYFWQLSTKIPYLESGQLDEPKALQLLQEFREEVVRRYRDPNLQRTVKTFRQIESGDGNSLPLLEMMTKNLISLTYKQHMLVKNPVLEPFLSRQEKDPTHRMMKVFPINCNLTLTYLLGRPVIRGEKTIANFVMVLPNSMPAKKKIVARQKLLHSHTMSIHLVSPTLAYLIHLL